MFSQLRDTLQLKITLKVLICHDTKDISFKSSEQTLLCKSILGLTLQLSDIARISGYSMTVLWCFMKFSFLLVIGVRLNYQNDNEDKVSNRKLDNNVKLFWPMTTQ